MLVEEFDCWIQSSNSMLRDEAILQFEAVMGLLPTNSEWELREVVIDSMENQKLSNEQLNRLLKAVTLGIWKEFENSNCKDATIFTYWFSELLDVFEKFYSKWSNSSRSSFLQNVIYPCTDRPEISAEIDLDDLALLLQLRAKMVERLGL